MGGGGKAVACQGAISEWEDDFRKKLEADIFLNSPDFEVPIYNVWKQQSKTAGVNHFGNSEVRWLACHTQEEIAEAVDVAVQTASNWCEDFSKSSEIEELEKWTDFDLPIYNIWKQQNKSNKADHFGNSECGGSWHLPGTRAIETATFR